MNICFHFKHAIYIFVKLENKDRIKEQNIQPPLPFQYLQYFDSTIILISTYYT